MAYVVACKVMPFKIVSNEHLILVAQVPYTLVFDSIE